MSQIVAESKKITNNSNQWIYLYILQVDYPQTVSQSLKVADVSWCEGIVCRDIHGHIHWFQNAVIIQVELKLEKINENM